MIQTASFRFIQSLNDFLPGIYKNKPVNYTFEGTPAIKDSIEAIGIPHTEVSAVLVNGSAVNFFYKLQNHDTVEVYPAESNPVASTTALIPVPDHPIAFIADVHLGKLAKALRILGFDTIYQNRFTDKSIVELAAKDHRIVLTRDVGLLKHKSIKWGYWLRSQMMEKQLEEVIMRYNLLPEISTFKRCLQCNGEIKKVQKETVMEKLPPKTAHYFHEFYQCASCKKIYWKGSHYEHMMKTIEKNLSNYSNLKFQ